MICKKWFKTKWCRKILSRLLLISQSSSGSMSVQVAGSTYLEGCDVLSQDKAVPS